MKKFDIELPKSLTEIVVARVRQAIIDGDFALGQAISEESLAESFGVSRTPVRDALTLLQATGLVEIRAKRGSFVFQPDLADVRAICEFRRLLEVQAARQSLAADRAALLGGLRAAHAEMVAADAADDTVRYGHSDTAFHEALFAPCGNRYLQDAYRLVSGRIAALRTHMSRQFSDSRAVSLDEHQKMIDLISRADFDTLGALMDAHIGRTVDAFILADSQGQFGAARPAAVPVRAG